MFTLTLILAISLLVSTTTGYVMVKRARTKSRSIQAQAVVKLEQYRERANTMRQQIIALTTAIQHLRQQLDAHEMRKSLEIALDLGAFHTSTDKVLTSTGFAETLPVAGFAATQPCSGFQQTRQEHIEGFVGHQRAVPRAAKR